MGMTVFGWMALLFIKLLREGTSWIAGGLTVVLIAFVFVTAFVQAAGLAVWLFTGEYPFSHPWSGAPV